MSVVKVFNNGNSRIVIDDHCYCVEIYQSDENVWRKTSWISDKAMKELKKLPEDPNVACVIAWDQDVLENWILDVIRDSANQEYICDVAAGVKGCLDKIMEGTITDDCDDTVNLLTSNPEVRFLVNSIKGEFISISKVVESNKADVIICSELARLVSE